MPGPLSSFDGSGTSRTTVPGVKSKTTVRLTCAVAPVGLTATMFSTVVPPVTATATLNDPSAAATVEAVVVCEFWSVFVAAT